MPKSFWNLLNDYKIIIPIIQRDYAQGRETGKVPLIRKRFLMALSEALQNSESPLELDFIYGYINNEEKFIPLDGQQRLTTLFLLHWYAAVKEGFLTEATTKLSRFTYEIRHSSSVFCAELVKYQPDSFDDNISKSIFDQPWFFTAWKNDPTIKSMLTMLEAIERIISEKNIKGIWTKLTSDKPVIVFNLLSMEKLGLPDDLYIKMNSRGKELTNFEHFKSRFSEILNLNDSVIFNQKIDRDWADLFWNLFKDSESNDNEKSIDIAQSVDSGFLRFIRYTTDLLISLSDDEVDEELDELLLFGKIYARKENVEFLFSILDTMYKTNTENSDFFHKHFYVNQEDYGKVKVRLFFSNPRVDLFKKCIDCYDRSQRNNPFSIGEQLMLYACLIHLQSESLDFPKNIRVLRNLIANSEDEVRKGNIPAILRTIQDIILNDKLDIDSAFNTTQVEEEKFKGEFIKTNKKYKDIVYQLEDHHLLQGCTAMFKLDSKINIYAVAYSGETCRPFRELTCHFS